MPNDADSGNLHALVTSELASIREIVKLQLEQIKETLAMYRSDQAVYASRLSMVEKLIERHDNRLEQIERSDKRDADREQVQDDRAFARVGRREVLVIGGASSLMVTLLGHLADWVGRHLH